MPKWTKSESNPVRIGLLLFDRFSNLCLANCLEPLRAANSVGMPAWFEWQILTPLGRPAISSSGIEVMPHATLQDMGSVNYLFVLASYGHDQLDTKQIRSDLRAAARKADVVAGFDAAPWLMASAGLLDGRRATIHWDLLGAFMERFTEIDITRARVIRDHNRWTCAGALSALDVSLDMISDHAGLAVRLDVEAMFMQSASSADGLPMKTSDTLPANARTMISDPLIDRALMVMRAEIEHPLTVTALAARLSCQSRTLDRRFRKTLGAPPGEVYRHLRLSSARQKCENTHLSIADIALRTGYESPAALSRAIKRTYGTTPSALRKVKMGVR